MHWKYYGGNYEQVSRTPQVSYREERETCNWGGIFGWKCIEFSRISHKTTGYTRFPETWLGVVIVTNQRFCWNLMFIIRFLLGIDLLYTHVCLHVKPFFFKVANWNWFILNEVLKCICEFVSKSALKSVFKNKFWNWVPEIGFQLNY